MPRSTAHPSLPPLGCTLMGCSRLIIGSVHIYFGILKCKRQTFLGMINLGNALFPTYVTFVYEVNNILNNIVI